MKNRFIFAAIATASLIAAASANAVPFPRADRNHDGVVDYPEAKRAFPGLAEVHFHKCDHDGDGVLDRGEFPLLVSMYRSLYLNK